MINIGSSAWILAVRSVINHLGTTETVEIGPETSTIGMTTIEEILTEIAGGEVMTLHEVGRKTNMMTRDIDMIETIEMIGHIGEKIAQEMIEIVETIEIEDREIHLLGFMIFMTIKIIKFHKLILLFLKMRIQIGVLQKALSHLK